MKPMLNNCKVGTYFNSALQITKRSLKAYIPGGFSPVLWKQMRDRHIFFIFDFKNISNAFQTKTT